MPGLSALKSKCFSNAKLWTSMTKVIKQKQTTLRIKVKPKYIPNGIEDKTEINVGVRSIDGEVEFVTAFLWRINDQVFSSFHGAGLMKKKIESESKIMKLTVNIPQLIVLSSDGLAAKHQGQGKEQRFLGGNDLIFKNLFKRGKVILYSFFLGKQCQNVLVSLFWERFIYLI